MYKCSKGICLFLHYAMNMCFSLCGCLLQCVSVAGAFMDPGVCFCSSLSVFFFFPDRNVGPENSLTSLVIPSFTQL